MTYLESFLDLIKSKKKTSGKERILLALKEVAYALGQNGVSIYTEREIADALSHDPFMHKILFHDTPKEEAISFDIRFIILDNIVSVIKELEKENIISFDSKYNFLNLFKPPADPEGAKFFEDSIKENPINKISFFNIERDDIFLEIKEGFDSYYRKYKQKTKLNKKAGNKIESPYKLPYGTEWERVEIKFKDADSIEVFNNKEKHCTVSYKDLGFYSGKKNSKPDMPWLFLSSLAIAQSKDEKGATVDDMIFHLTSKKGGKKITKDNCQQIKLKLSKKLREVFDVVDDPFWEYEKYRCYKTKFTLKPVPLMRTEDPYLTKRNKFDENFDYGGKAEEKHKEYIEDINKKDKNDDWKSIDDKDHADDERNTDDDIEGFTVD